MEIVTLYKNKEKNQVIYPRTALSAVLLNDGTPLNNTIENLINYKPDRIFVSFGSLSSGNAYQTITWNSDITKYKWLNIFTLVEGVVYKNYVDINILSSSQITVTLSMHTSVRCYATLNKLQNYSYSGNWYQMPTIIYASDNKL